MTSTVGTESVVLAIRGIKIDYITRKEMVMEYENIIKASNDKKIILKGVTGSGKSTLLMQRYKYMVEELKIPSEKILILLLNRNQSLGWRKKVTLKSSGNIWRKSYFGFIQEELTRYYPIVLKDCPYIGKKSIEPTFLTFETAQFLLKLLIDKKREKPEFFSSLTAFNSKVAIDIASNLVKASASSLPHDRIGARLYKSLEVKTDDKKQIFMQADEIIKLYRDRCFEVGVLDFSMAIDVYNSYLLKDKGYQQSLKDRVEHLIIDNIEEAIPTQIDFITQIMPNLKSCMLSYNPEGGYGALFGANHNYMQKNILDKCQTYELDKKCYTCEEPMYEFSQMLFDTLVPSEDLRNNTLNTNIKIERTPAVDLRSEMLESASNKVIELVKSGVKSTDITIISSFADTVTEYVVSRLLEKSNIKLTNLSRKSRIVDNPFSQALVTLGQLCYPRENKIPNSDDVKALINLVLKIDPVRSSILAQLICNERPFASFPDITFPGVIERVGFRNADKYKYIREWIEEYKKETPLPINEFFQKVFMEILITNDVTQKDILEAKKLIDSAQNFVDAVARFNRSDPNRDFLDMITNGVKSAESIFEIEEKLLEEAVTLTTPMNYLASSMNSKVVIILSLSSNNWTPRCVKEISNPYVLTKTWIDEDVYTEEIEDKNQRSNLALMMRAILKRCGERLITFESNLSSNGYENDGPLAECFDSILRQ